MRIINSSVEIIAESHIVVMLGLTILYQVDILSKLGRHGGTLYLLLA